MGKRAFQKLFVYVSVLEEGLGGALGVDGGLLPLPTCPQRYCDPPSLFSKRDLCEMAVLMMIRYQDA